MATTAQIPWGDGTGEELTVTYIGTTGTEVTVSSPQNFSGADRSKTLKIKTPAGVEVLGLSVNQPNAQPFDVVVDDNGYYIYDESGNAIYFGERVHSFVEVAGLLWETENVVINGKKFFVYADAMQVAADRGLRLPSVAELTALCSKAKVWDDVLLGVWLADNSNDLKDATKSIFVPVWGYGNTLGVLTGQEGLYGYIHSDTDGSDMIISSTGTAGMTIHPVSTYGFSIRCVKSL